MGYTVVRGGEIMPNNDCGCKEDCYDIQPCEKNVSRTYDINVPVTVKPYATAGKPEVKCAGECEVCCGHKRCGNPDSDFEFTLTQKITIDIPIKCGAEICYGKTCCEGQCKGDGEVA